jgi:hypothetical protein
MVSNGWIASSAAHAGIANPQQINGIAENQRLAPIRSPPSPKKVERRPIVVGRIERGRVRRLADGRCRAVTPPVGGPKAIDRWITCHNSLLIWRDVSQ